MVQLSAMRAANAQLVNSQPLVAVFVGGTSGIGEYTLRELVKTHSSRGKGLCIYIVGRNAAAAEKITSDCAAACPDGEYRFVQAKDLSLLRDVDAAAAEIARRVRESAAEGQTPRIDLLFMSQGGLYLGGRKETAEGIDYGMAMHYYSRARFAHQLLPLLQASPLPAHVVSVYAAGMEARLVPADLSLRRPGSYSFANARSHCTFMTTLFFEALARQAPGRISLVNVFPGLVITAGFEKGDYPLWLRAAWRLMAPLAKVLLAVPADESGQRTLFLATDRFPARGGGPNEKSGGGVAVGTDGEVGSGAYACNKDGEPTSAGKRAKAFRGLQRGELADAVWKHTMRAFEAAAAGEKFSE